MREERVIIESGVGGGGHFHVNDLLTTAQIERGDSNIVYRRREIFSIFLKFYISYSLQTTLLNKHLSELMAGLTAKVFRTYNASKTLQEQLDELTEGRETICFLHLYVQHV